MKTDLEIVEDQLCEANDKIKELEKEVEDLEWDKNNLEDEVSDLEDEKQELELKLRDYEERYPTLSNDAVEVWKDELWVTLKQFYSLEEIEKLISQRQ